MCVFSYSWFFGGWIKLLYTIITQMYNFFTIVTTFAPFFSLSRKLGSGSEMQNESRGTFILHFARLALSLRAS